MTFQFTVDGNDFLRAGEASTAVKRTLKQLGLESSLVRRIGIAMYEAEMNMVIHAHGGTIWVELTDTKLTIVLKDRGPGIIDIDLAMQEGYSTASQEIRELGFGAGMGLPNMKRYSDRLEVTTQVGLGTQIILEFNL
ncbi:MAG: ATP-binding protein [Cellulosilyticum sp.]|nr:ATP-binding protein [Cellulosilyticum sp.]